MINVDHNPVETEDGVWTQYNGSKLLICHISSMAFQRKLARLQLPYAKKIREGKLAPDIQKEILCEAMSGTILKDWDDVVDSNGAKVAFDVRLCKQALMNQVDVREFVTEFAVDLDHFRKEEADALGNS